MNHRRTAVCVASAFIILIVLVSVYFLAARPQRGASRSQSVGEKVLLFRDVKYTGEKGGTVSWEVRAKLVRKFMDRPDVEMEGIEGESRPKPDTVVSFKGSKGQMDTAKEKGSVRDVEVYYRKEYVIKSLSMDFDFGNSLVSTSSPVDVEGKKFTMMGVGLKANTKDQVINVERDVSGTIQQEKGKYRFSADKFTYLMKDSTYILEGRVVVKGEKMDILCDRVVVLSKDDEPEKADATGHVSILSKGTIAKSERAVYYFRDEKAVLNEKPSITSGQTEMHGETITYDLKEDRFFVEKPKMRIEQQKR
jgi:lipopolysaccharide transport protein LptA